MIINNKMLKEIYVEKVRPPKGACCEHFYAVPNTVGYVLSDFGRLYKWSYTWSKKGGYNKIHPKYNSRLQEEVYKIRFLGDETDTEIPVRKLIARVFYPDLTNIYLYRLKDIVNWELRWSIYDLHVLNGKAEIAEAISAKIEHREPTYDENKKGCTFINRFDTGGDFRKVIHRIKWNVLSRAGNANCKNRFPRYKNCTYDPEFKASSTKFGQWYIDSHYDYPSPLDVDKDLLGFGEADCYSIQYMTLLPRYINLIFATHNSELGYSIQQKQTATGAKCYYVSGAPFAFDEYTPTGVLCNSYAEALTAAREMKAGYLCEIVKKERNNGHIPELILEAIEKWANLCKLGLIKKWEPSALTIAEKEII